MSKQMVTVLAYIVALLITYVSICDKEESVPKAESEPITTTSVRVTETTTPAALVTETTTTTTEAPAAYYPMTDEERMVVEQVVMAEAGGESYEGQMAVAQCILNACFKRDMRPIEAIENGGYTSYRPDPSESVKEAVEAVFGCGEKVVTDETIYFYAPALCTSEWHESQVYTCTIGGHRFFEEE